MADAHSRIGAGGNVTAEALYGTYNPVILLDSVAIALIPNLGIGITLVKMQFMAILAVGVYLVARQYGANRSMAFIAGFAMPFAGYASISTPPVGRPG